MEIHKRTTDDGKVNTMVQQVTEIRRLEGWLTLKEAAEVLGYSTQGLHRVIFLSPHSPFDLDKDVRGVGEKPLLVIREAKVHEVLAKRRRPVEDDLNGRSKLILSTGE